MDNIRALFAGAVLSPSWRGGEPRVARSVIDGFIQRNITVHTVGFLRGGRVHALSSMINPLDVNPLYYRRYLKIIKEFRPHIIFSWFDYDTSLLAAGLKLKVPIVACIHIYWPICQINTLWYNGVCNGPTKKRCYEHILLPKKHIYRLLSMHGKSLQMIIKKRKERLNQVNVIVPSSHMKNKLIEHGFNPMKINVIQNGVDLNMFKKREGWKGPTKIILFVGHTSEQKGFQDFTKMANVLETAPNVEFIAVGHGLSVDPVKALGYLGEKNFYVVLDQAYVVVFPSLWDEPFGLVPIEAMAMEKPVIAYSVGALPEIVSDGITGFLVPRGKVKILTERVRDLLHNDELATKMGVNGRRIVEIKFNLENTVNKYYELMRKIVG